MEEHQVNSLVPMVQRAFAEVEVTLDSGQAAQVVRDLGAEFQRYQSERSLVPVNGTRITSAAAYVRAVASGAGEFKGMGWYQWASLSGVAGVNPADSATKNQSPAFYEALERFM